MIQVLLNKEDRKILIPAGTSHLEMRYHQNVTRIAIESFPLILMNIPKIRILLGIYMYLP